MSELRFDLPLVDDETRAFWTASQDGRLLLKVCAACGAVHYYPRSFCPECWSEDVSWLEASGRATLYTHSTVYMNDLPPFGERVPYIAAVVDLAEGPRMMTEVIDATPDQLEIGMALQVVFRPLTDDVTIAVFRPA